MHYYKFNIKDWSRDTAHLTVEEECVYRRLIDLYYESEMPIPEKTHSVIRRLRLGGYEQQVSTILEEFFKLSEDGFHHTRCDEEIARYHSKARSNRLNGSAGGRPKKPTNNPDGFQKEPNRNLNQEPLTINQEEDQKNTAPAKAAAVEKLPVRHWVKELMDMGVDEQSAKDWMEVRKVKKAKMTDSALEATKREATKAGMTLGQAVKVCAERSWQGFKAEWLQGNNSASTKHTGFGSRDYLDGLTAKEDGSYGF